MSPVIGTDLVTKAFFEKFNGRGMKLLQGVQFIIFDVLFDLVVAIFVFFSLLFSSEGEETDDDYKSDAPDSEDDSNDVVLAFIASDEEYADERPATTRSGRAVTRRAEIDFSFF